MNQEDFVHRMKNIVNSVKKKIRHGHKTPVEDDLNEYEKMKIETLLKKEMNDKLGKDLWIPEKMLPDKGNNRDISEI